MNMKPTRRTWLALCAALSLSVPSFLHPTPDPTEPVTVIVVRHAETAGSSRTGGDPKLSESGEQRAVELAKLLEHAGVTHLYSSQFERTKAVLAPLAEASGLEVESLDADALKEQIERVQALPPGSVAVIAGHSNTVPAMVLALGGTPQRTERHPQYGPMLAHTEYGRLFLLTLPPAKATAQGTTTQVKLLELHYGE